MTVIQEILEAISHHENEIKRLTEALRDIQKECPHPKFLVTKVKEGSPTYEDDYGCTVYGSEDRFHCGLCGSTIYRRHGEEYSG